MQMKQSLIKTVVKLLRDTADKLDAGTSELSPTEAMDIADALCHHVMSKETACRYLNLSRSRFDELIREKKIPQGRKRIGFKEKVWYEDELDECIKKIKR